MGNINYFLDYDRFDERNNKESIGSFGTTTVPGGDQLKELLIKIRQGVKHVELHLNNTGKGEFSRLDTPDKYGYKERRTIMQLAKMNQQTMSVHSSLNMTSLAGLEKNGFDESARLEALKEMEETVKFASETTKGGAIVMHLQGELPSPRTEMKLSKSYIEWLKKNNPNELKEIEKNYFNRNPYDRLFVENPEKVDQLKYEYERLSDDEKNKLELKYEKEIKSGIQKWEVYAIEQQVKKTKLNPDLMPYVVTGDNIQQLDRKVEFADLTLLRDEKNFTDDEKKILLEVGVEPGKHIDIDAYQKIMGFFSADAPIDEKVDKKMFFNLKQKIMCSYDKTLAESYNLQNQADVNFFNKLNANKLEEIKLMRNDLVELHKMYSEELDQIKQFESTLKKYYSEIKNLDQKDESYLLKKSVLDEQIKKTSQMLSSLKYSVIGQEEYSKLASFDSKIAELNKAESELVTKQENTLSLVDSAFEKNIKGLAYLGVKALKHQMDLKLKSQTSIELKNKIDNQIKDLTKKYYDEKDVLKQDELANLIAQKENERDRLVGLSDYNDIDLENRPLYISPENMLPGMGNLTSIEEFKSLIIMGWESFADNILSNNPEFKKIREEYENLTGKKIKDRKDAIELAKKHIAGTLDTAHAATWLKHFKKNESETEEERINRFNDWIEDQAQKLVKDNIVKHVHLNDSTGKDDDHNSIGSGILRMHNLRKKMRDAGLSEPFIIEAGGRGANKLLHLKSTFELFNPSVFSQKESPLVDSGISNWISVQRNYENRKRYEVSYGFAQSTFSHVPPKENQQRGLWSGTSFF